MSVRWKRVRRWGVVQQTRLPFATWIEERWVRQAVLVARRRRNDVLRVRTVCILGGIREGREADVGAVRHFWASVDRRLAGLALSDETRARLMAEIDAVVPRPSDDVVVRWSGNVKQTIRTGLDAVRDAYGRER